LHAQETQNYTIADRILPGLALGDAMNHDFDGSLVRSYLAARDHRRLPAARLALRTVSDFPIRAMPEIP
jgi:hypothetical protein